MNCSCRTPSEIGYCNNTGFSVLSVSKLPTSNFRSPDYKLVAFKGFSVGLNRNRGGRQVSWENLIEAKIVDNQYI